MANINFPVLRRDSRRRLRYNPRSEAFASSVPSSAAYENSQNFAQAFHRMVRLNLVRACETAQNLARAVTLATSAPSLTTYETARSFARAFSATPVPGNEKPAKPPSTLLGRCAAWCGLPCSGLRNRPELCSGVSCEIP